MRPFHPNGSFHPTLDDGGLARRAIRGAGVTVFSGILVLALQTISTLVLVRILAPADFGLVAMVTTFSMVLLNVGINGFTEAMIQREDLDHTLASSLFWINLGAGVLLTAGFAAGGSLLARFYGEPRVSEIAVGLSLTIFFTSLSVQHLALLKRGMRFLAVSSNDMAARTLSVAVTIVLGWAGWGYWALIVGANTLALSTTVGAWLLCRWMPGRPRFSKSTGETLRFAAHTYGRFVVNYLARNIDNLIVGWRFGSISLGFYKKAYDLFALPAGQVVSPLTEVALSTLSRLNPKSPQYRQYFLSALSMLALLGMALAAILTLVGKDLIRLLLGPKWEAAGGIFVYFGPGIGAMFVYHTQGWIHLSIGRADRWLRWTIVEVVVTVLLFFVAVPWGPAGIAVAWTASFWILAIPALWYAGSTIDFRIGTMLCAIWKYVVAAILAGCMTAAIASPWTLPAGPAVAAFRIGVGTGLFLFGYLTAIIVLHRGCEPLYQFFWLAKEMAPWARSNQAPSSIGFPGGSQTWEGADFEDPKETAIVSILIPAYNAQEWIADTIGSALSQTWPRKEIIVVDDGSTDQTAEIAKRFASEGVRVVTQKNQGAAAARNHAFSLSRGDYIQWLDADDLLAPDKIAKQMKVLADFPNKRILLSSAWGRFRYRYYRAEFNPSALWCDLSPAEWLLRKMEHNIYMQTATWLVSRELCDAAGPWDTTLMGDDDGEYFCRVLLASEGVRFVADAKVYYRAPSFGSLAYLGTSTKKLQAHWKSMSLHIQYLRSLDNGERARTACLKFLDDSFVYFYPESKDIVAQMEQMAQSCGGSLAPPQLSWKYGWIMTCFGWTWAKRAHRVAPRVKWAMKAKWDKLIFRIEARKPPAMSERHS